jgi:hypothetical protein
VLSRRSFLKRSAAVLGLLATGIEIAPVTASVPNSPWEMPLTPSQTNYLPVFRRALADARNVCPRVLGSYFPYLNNIAIPAVYRTGAIPDCAVAAQVYDNAQGFNASNNPTLLNPLSFVKPEGIISTVANVPENPDISAQVFKDYADMPTIDLATKKMQMLGAWGIPASEATTSSILNPGQLPDTPVDWEQWRKAAEGVMIGDINDKLHDSVGEHIYLELSPISDVLWTGFFEDVSIGKPLQDLCPRSHDMGLYVVELLTVFPMVDMRGGIPVLEVWAHIKHVDARVEIRCDPDDEYLNYQFIKLDTLLVGAPIEVRGEAQRRIERETRIWPIQGMEFQPIGGGISQETLGQVAMIIVGGLIIVAIIALIAAQPQFILVAAVAL